LYSDDLVVVGSGSRIEDAIGEGVFGEFDEQGIYSVVGAGCVKVLGNYFAVSSDINDLFAHSTVSPMVLTLYLP
jgi:hypothetical protein